MCVLMLDAAGEEGEKGEGQLGHYTIKKISC